MSEIKITDLVPQETIDKVKELNTEVQSLLTTYTNTARDLAKGIDINVRVIGDIDKLEKLLVEKTKEATSTTEKLNEVIARQGQVIANTTNTISRQLMEQERVNKTQREAYTDTESFKKLLEQVNGSYENRVKRLVETNQAIAANKKQQDDLKKSLDMGRISQEQYNKSLVELTMTERELKQSKADLTNHLKNEEREMQSVEGSYKNLSQRLELMKRAYKDLTEEERSSPLGKEMETAIQNLDAHLKDVAADMGEFQRNVGNYAIAGQNGVVATESLVAVMNQQAITLQDVADQTKILEEGKRMLDTTDEHYAETLAAINAQIDENKAKLTDVSDIMEKDASSAAEAEAQNKRLQEAMKHIDVTADGAQERIDELNARIERNNAVIGKATPTTERLAKEQKELAEAAKKAEKELANEQKTNSALAGQMLSLIGVNENFASSLTSIESGGNVMDGLNTKVKAFGKTLLGLLANPWVLAFLGIAGVVAGFKWWYDYNKGLIEATKLTKNYAETTDTTADDIKHLRSEVMAMADYMEKDFDATIGGANTLVQQFGISWEEAVETMRKGIEAGADINGNLLDNIEQFAPAFKDAGLSAEEFMSLLAQTRNGIFDERALKSISDASGRIRNMTEKTKGAIDGIGLSSKQMQQDLEDGTITMLQAIQQVTDKMKELPPNCQEIGNVMTNVFGRKSVKAGEELLESISDIEGSLDDLIEQWGVYGKIAREEMEAQTNLQEALAGLFDQTGGNFEELTSKAKVFAMDALTRIIVKVTEIVNWFIDFYNRSVNVRRGIAAIGVAFMAMWEIAKFVMNFAVNGFKTIAELADAALSLDWDGVKSAYERGFSNIVENGTAAFNKIKDSAIEAFSTAETAQLKSAGVQTSGVLNVSNANPGTISEISDIPVSDKASKDAEKRAKEELKRLYDLEDSKIAMMADSHEKDLALIRQKFKKKLDEIKGNGETENALRLQLAEQCQKEIADCELKYQQELSKINLTNRLACVKKGSQEELDLKLAQLEASRAAEIKAAEKTGADVNLINAKFNQERADLEAEYANNRATKIEEQYGIEAIQCNKAYSDAVNILKERYTKEVELANGNATKQEELKHQLENNLYKLEVEYTQKTAEASIKMIEEILNLESMSADDRLRWENELAKSKIALAEQVADANAESVERQIADDDRLREKRKANLERWLSVASDAIGNISDLVDTLYDGQIDKIEEEQEANTEAGEKEQVRISELVEKKVITQEEGEARKRAAEAQTAKKNEELEKKKAQLQHKQAVFQKATDLAQAGISTALAITNALTTSPFPLGLAMAAVAGAMGAVQIATILATPIPKYAKGTDYHKGGPAIVGDGGRPEVVLYNGGVWLTPDKPTLVDMPRGAVVVPDINDLDDNSPELVMLPIPVDKWTHRPYDDAGIRKGVAELAYLLREQTKAQYSIAYMSSYESFKSMI